MRPGSSSCSTSTYAAEPMLRLGDPSEGSPFGLCVHQLTQNTGPAMQALDELNVRWVRIDVNWMQFEPQAAGSFDRAALDNMINTARAQGYLIFASIGYTPK